MPHATTPRQLPLPLVLPVSASASLLPPDALVLPCTVWASLATPDQLRFRRTLITLLQEVARVADAG
jgi:hypothetical protein